MIWGLQQWRERGASLPHSGRGGLIRAVSYTHLDVYKRQLLELSRLARREGLLALESAIAKEEDRFLRKGLQLVVDGTDGQVLQSIMQTEVRNRGHRHKQGAAFFTAMGALAPTIGITGTVIHLVHIMGQLDDPSALGPAIAAAFCACLYGVALSLIHI